MVNQVVHPNSTTDTYAKDANDIPRPAWVTVQGPLGIKLWATGPYTYDGSGNVWKMGSGSTTDTFVYDKVSRLVRGTITSVAKKQCMVFDAFGNVRRADVIASSGTCATTPSIDINPATNRMNSPVTYDGAGEQRSWNSGAYVYWWYPTGQMRQFEGSGRTTIYGYTADGERVGTYDSTPPSGITYTLRGLDGKVLRTYRESGGVWTWVQDYVYRDGAHLATVDSSGTKHFHRDHLGTVRLITNSSGSQVALHTYYPFGQEATSTTQDAERMKFTGYERDNCGTAGALDYMHARYYNPTIGRFLSVDPGGDTFLSYPQSWNLYAYARDNPARRTDPSGMAVFETAERLAQVAEAVMARSDLQPILDEKGKVVTTFCNFGVRAILNEGGDRTLDGMKAAAIVAFLSDPKNATQVSYTAAVAYAKAGATVIMAEGTSRGGGHVAVVAPTDPVVAGKKWDGQVVPSVFNVGKGNATMPLNVAFSASNKPRAFILNTDKAIIDKRQPPIPNINNKGADHEWPR